MLMGWRCVDDKSAAASLANNPTLTMAKTIFDMPKGIAEFDELEDGEKMQFSGTLRKEPGGKACLVSVDGKTVPGYSDSDEEEEDEDEYEEDESEEMEMGMGQALDEVM